MGQRTIIILAACFLTLTMMAGAHFVGREGDQIAGATTTSITVPVEADSWVRSTHPDRNYGSHSYLHVDGDPVMRTFLRFNIPELPAEVDRATLHIHAEARNRHGFSVHHVGDNSWGEYDVTFANQPGINGGPVGVSDAFGANEIVRVDVTAAVQSSGPVSFALVSDGDTRLKFTSREGGAPGPQLTLEFATVQEPDPTPTATPEPTATPVPTEPPEATPTPIPEDPASEPDNESLAFPIRATFYYPWFPNAWRQGGLHPFTQYEPELGLYDVRDSNVLSQHVEWMQYAGFDAAIASWWGIGHHTDDALTQMLNQNVHNGLKWAIYHEEEARHHLTQNEIRQDLQHVLDTFVSTGNYLHVDGKPVVFVYNAGPTSCDVSNRWTPVAQEMGVYLSLKVFSGFRDCAVQPDTWHQYGPANPYSNHRGYHVNISPGFYHAREAEPRLPRDPDRFSQHVRDMVASGEDWHLVTSFNEWGEGTIIEPAAEWGTLYLDILAANGVYNPDDSEPDEDPGPVPSPEGSVSIAAAGDIACDPTDGHFRNGLGSATRCRQMHTAFLVERLEVDYALVLGDFQYEDGTLEQAMVSYHPSWGRFLDKTYPVVGNHEYHVPGAQGYFDYYGDRAGPPGGYYAVELSDSWLAIGLNSNCSRVGGCDAGSAQFQFVRTVLDAYPDHHVLLFMHHPIWSVGNYHDRAAESYLGRMSPIIQLANQRGHVVTLSGHDHNMQAFSPMRLDGTPDQLGVRHFVSGAGGKNTRDVDCSLEIHCVFADGVSHGVLWMDLHADGSYDFAFIRDDGEVLYSATHDAP
jgi:hypothetical protein